MPNSVSFPANLSDSFGFIVSEANGYQSREEIVCDASLGVAPGGTILAKTAGGTWVPWGTASTTGVCILGADVDTTTGAKKRVGFFRNMEVQKARLAFAGTPDAPTQNAAFTALAAAGVALR